MEPILGGIVLFWLLAILFIIVSSVFWIVELVDACRRTFENDTVKVVWIVVLCLSHFIGAIVYYIIGKPMGTLPGQGAYR